MMLETSTAHPDTRCCICGYILVKGDRVLRWHLPPLVACLLGAKNHASAWLYLCRDCAYTGYALFDYGRYNFDPEQEAKERPIASYTSAASTMPYRETYWRVPCGRCNQPIPGPIQVHEGIGLCPTCAALIAPSRPT